MLVSVFRERQPQRPGYPAPVTQRLDEFQHHVAEVGPVQAGYFCLQQFGMLLAHDTATGAELWRRYDLPQRAVCLGNDSHVAVIAPLSQRVDIYNARDGRWLANRPWTVPRRDVLQTDRNEVILARGDRMLFAAEKSATDTPSSPDEPASKSAVELERRDVISGETRWRRRFPVGSIPFRMDDCRLGVLAPGGRVEFIRLSDGATTAAHELELPEPVERIICSAGEADDVIVFSGEVKDSSLRSAPQFRGGYRRPFVSGPALGFDRESGRLLWRTDLGATVFPLDQPVDLPVFVTSEGRMPAPDAAPGDEAPTTSRLQCFDRRTGNLLGMVAGAQGPEYAIVGNREARHIRILTFKTRMEIDFSPPVEEPQPGSIPADPPSATGRK
jgi:hypothetical protein